MNKTFEEETVIRMFNIFKGDRDTLEYYEFCSTLAMIKEPGDAALKCTVLTHTHTHTHKHIYIYTYYYTYIITHLHTRIYVYTYIYIYIYIFSTFNL